MRAVIRKITRYPSARVTNLTLLAALLVAFATGLGSVATGSPQGRWVVLAHGIGGVLVILLTPWKSLVVRHGLRRSRPSRWASLLLVALVIITLVTGLGSSTGLMRSIIGQYGIWVHVAAALTLVPLLVLHLFTRPTWPRRTDLSRRAFLRTGVLGAAAVGLYLATDAAVRVAALPGASRRFTGSHEIGSFEPDAMPSTIWLNDTTPTIDPDRWRLTIADHDGEYQLTLPELTTDTTSLRATLDCTSGWYSHQDWTGVPVSALVRNTGDATSLVVHSVTGYWIRFPISEIPELLLATHVGGMPLAHRHGYPLRLVAPNRRGYWWVKWVDHIELQKTPAWWQPPFPVA